MRFSRELIRQGLLNWQATSPPAIRTMNKAERMRNETEIRRLCDQVREAAFSLHAYLGHGHMEKVYENGLANRLCKLGLRIDQQQPLRVADEDGTILGDYFVDLLVENVLVLELKTCKSLGAEHFAQVLGYLRASDLRDALLINFGAPKFQIRKLIL
jgi:GxxExxY protein